LKRSFVILLNLGYWILYLLLLAMLMLMMQAGNIKTGVSKQDMIFGFFKLMALMTILPGLISFYSFYHFIFDYFLSRKKIISATLFGFAIAICCGILALVGLDIMNKGMLFRFNGKKEIVIMIAFLSVLCLIHGIIALVIKGFINWYGDIKVKEELKQKNLETELALVKSQLNPHFLFNTINNIDVLIEKNPAKASLYLNKLSDIMRFMLYETKSEKILLEQELVYITKYIDLQKIRNANPDFVSFRIQGNPGVLKIAPMLFVPFIENAFKHASNKKAMHGISIDIDIRDHRVDFICTNKYANNPLNKTEAGGLGTELMLKRLALLYPGKHELEILQEEAEYSVKLSIQVEL
jgi:two-component system LytT family sensor kinase